MVASSHVTTSLAKIVNAGLKRPCTHGVNAAVLNPREPEPVTT